MSTDKYGYGTKSKIHQPENSKISDSISNTVSVILYVHLWFLFSSLVFPNVSACSEETVILKSIGSITHPGAREASGLVASLRYPGIFWTVCDSGNPPLLFGIDRTGRLLAEYQVGALNLDWESLALDEQGNLYIGDVGNNFPIGGLPVRWVYRIREPDLTCFPPVLRNGPIARLKVEKLYAYTFPEKPFDVEGMFTCMGRLYLVSKSHSETTRLYRLPIEEEREFFHLIEVCRIPEVFSVTGADLSPDGRQLALCSYGYVAKFDLEPGEPLESLERKTPRISSFEKTTVEACCWEGEKLLLLGESRQMYQLDFQPSGYFMVRNESQCVSRCPVVPCWTSRWRLGCRDRSGPIFGVIRRRP